MRSVYVGRGDFASLAATLDEMEQSDQERGRMEERRQLEASASLDTDIDSLAKLASTLTEAVLITGGFHQHKRQWRKRKP